MKTSPKKRRFAVTLWRQRQLLLMSIPFLLYILLFSYVPLMGWALAFQDFRPRIGAGTPVEQIINGLRDNFVGFDHFSTLLNPETVLGARFLRSVVNSFGQGILTLAIGFIGAITLSLLLHEVKQNGIKRVMQNILYMPHFLSMIIVASLASTALALPVSGGFINQLLLTLRIIDEPILFLVHPEYFWGIVAGVNLWRSLGWNTIIYLAAISAVDPNLYEAADIDGASRYRKMWHITLASIRPTIVILLIMNTGWILNSGFELQFLLGSGINLPRAENIDVFIWRFGLGGVPGLGINYGWATAAGMIRTVFSVAMLATVNFIVGKLGGERLL